MKTFRDFLFTAALLSALLGPFVAPVESTEVRAQPVAVVGVVIAAVALVNGIRNVIRARQKEKNRRRKAEERLRFLVSPENFKQTFDRLVPIMRGASSQFIGSQVESATATQNARRGLTGTGVGATRSALAAGAGEQFSIASALGSTENAIRNQIAAEGFNPANVPSLSEQVGFLGGGADQAALGQLAGAFGTTAFFNQKTDTGDGPEPAFKSIASGPILPYEPPTAPQAPPILGPSGFSNPFDDPFFDPRRSPAVR